MRKVILFVEDDAHEAFLKALVDRLAGEAGVEVETRVGCATGGRGNVLSELKAYVRDIVRAGAVPDALVVAIDANCKGHQERKRAIEKAVGQLAPQTVCAIPDPHIERWLLLDAAAFKAVLNRGCSPPDQKCEKGRYKNLLRDAVRDAGVTPALGGIEYAEDIVREMDLERAAGTDRSFGSALDGLRAKFNGWQSG